MQDFLKILIGHWKKIVTIGVLTSIASVAFGFYYNSAPYGNTLFITVGAGNLERSGLALSPYDAVQAADIFSETVQGWFKNPSFLEKISTLSGIETGFSVRKQEKQNLVVFYKTATAEDGRKIGLITEELLMAEIGKYNRDAGSAFSMPNSEVHTGIGSVHPAVFASLGLFFGLFLGYFLSAFLEFFLIGLKQFRHR